MPKKIVVIGAGLGGLATAARLAHRGHQVLLLEKTDQVGGRNRQEQVGQCRFDGGPTLMMMLDPFRKLFSDLGTRLEHHLEISLCDPSYRVFYDDGVRIDGTPNVAQMLDQIRLLGGGEESAKYGSFLGRLSSLYHEAVPNFVRNNYRSVWDFAAPGQVKRVLKHKMLGNLAKQVSKSFSHEKLQMLFSFQTMYLGLSPYDAPWVYSTLTYMEYGEGIWYPKGGMAKLSETVASLAKSCGVDIRCGAEVLSITEQEVHLRSGEVIQADIIVCNADLPYAQESLLRRSSNPKLRYSCSAYVLYLEYEGELPDLLHHNVFFGRDFKGNLDAIFHHRKLPDDPAFYVCVSSKTDSDAAPVGFQNLFILIPCANLLAPFGEHEREYLKKKVFDRLAHEVGFDPSKVRGAKERTPHDWETDLNLKYGAAFGLSHDTFQSAFMRPKNRDKRNKMVYYVGASTIPGNGLPMVLISAELAEERMLKDGVLDP